MSNAIFYKNLINIIRIIGNVYMIGCRTLRTAFNATGLNMQTIQTFV